MESDLQITAMPLMEINVICTSYRKANRCVIGCALCCVFSGQLCAAAADLEQQLQKTQTSTDLRCNMCRRVLCRS